jgi:nucleoside-diphosphate-sugar epimerase
MKRVLITGSQGFVGRNLIEALSPYFAITGIDLADGVDLTGPRSFERIKGQFDAVVHLAGVSFVPDSFERPFDFHRINFNGALNIAEYCRRHSIQTLLYPNTYIYGQPLRLPVDEAHPISLPSPYHKSKKLAEDLLLGYFNADQTQVVALRVFNLYGPHQDTRFLVPQILRDARASGRVTVRDLEPRRDFLYIKDFVRLIRLVLECRDAAAGVYNVGSGRSYSVAELIDLVRDQLGVPLEVKNLNDRRPNEIMDCYADITKVGRVFGWKPAYSLRDGLQELLTKVDHV